MYLKPALAAAVFVILTNAAAVPRPRDETSSNRAAAGSGLTTQPAAGGIVAIGGGTLPDRIYKKILALSGRKEPRVLILPLATSEPEASGVKAANRFRECGATHVDWKHFKREQAEDNNILDPIRNANIIYFPGGDQKRILEIVKNTSAESAIRDVLSKGGVVGGTSAGCEVLGDLSLTGKSRLDLAVLGASEVEPGLGLMNGVLFDQHFLRRGRFVRLVSGTLDNEKKIGIGVDESTAVLLANGSRNIEIVGDRQVIIIRTAADSTKAAGKTGDLARASNLKLHILAEGDRYHLDRDEVFFADDVRLAPPEVREIAEKVESTSRPARSDADRK
ncbi:MAG: cyanophycinase [Planctomycetota bacterium]